MIMLFSIIKRHKLKGKARLRFELEHYDMYAEILGMTQKDAVLSQNSASSHKRAK